MKTIHQASYITSLAVAGFIGITSSAQASLVAYWPLDGNYADATGSWGSGTVVDADSKLSWVNDVPAQITGRATQSLRFEASSSKVAYIATGYSGEGTLGNTSRTISFWLKSGYVNGDTRHWGYGNQVAAQGFALSAGANDRTGIGTYFWNGYAETPDASYPTNNINTWDHIAVSYTGGPRNTSLTIYKNGVAQTPLSHVNNPDSVLNTTAGTFYIGTDMALQSNDIRNAWMSDMAVFNEALSLTDIQALAAGASPSSIPEPATTGLLALSSLLYCLRRKK